MDEIMKDPLSPYHEAAEEIQKIIKRGLQEEKDHLYQRQPKVLDDIVRIVKEEIK